MRRLLLALPVLLVACGAEPPPPATSGTAPILVSDHRQGMPTWSQQVKLPEFALYGDRRAIVPEGFDGALPKVVAYPLTPDRVRRLFADAADADLFDGKTHDVDVTDAGALVIALRSPDRSYVTKVIGPRDDESGARARAMSFAAGLTPARWPKSDFAGEPKTYEPAKLAVFFRASSEPGGEQWPLESSTHCTTLSGSQLAAATDLARRSGQGTRFRDGERAFTVDFRPLLPDEKDCESLRS
nr:hypothetical protein [Kibdelosporangium sp. MJ126-NF4]CEL23239.1 hypothetical protein [Kibdelosporangium sp. MJ126-NF4]CTQ94401.1 hypothetical protein [Kibdelosporangium sp. MJ126-NF4]